MKQLNLFKLCGLLFTALCFSIFLFNSCKKDDDDSSKSQEEEQVEQDLYEPNNLITEAALVTFDTEIKAWLTSKDDVDFYKFSGTASGKLDLLKFTLSNGTTDANFTITIYNENKEEIVQVPHAGNGVNLNHQMVTKDAVFYVKVSEKDSSSYPANYTLTAGFTNVADKFESNDDITTAALFPFNTVENCNLLTGDIDFYKIQDLSKENVWDIYEVKLENNTTDMSPAINFYDVNKEEIDGSETIVGQGKDITKQFFMKSGAGNAQYLKVHTLSPLATIPANYTLEVVKKNSNEASEPNDTHSTAQVITTDGIYEGTIIKKISDNPADCDIDFIKIVIPSGKSLRYKVTGSNVQYDIYLSYLFGSIEEEPWLFIPDRASSSTSTYSTSNSNLFTMYYYFALKATSDLSAWSAEIEIY